ncbi:MAG: Rrf2 family transcriptional regulator [Polyangiales bacterium]
MKLSNKCQYGIRVIFDIACFNDGNATQVKEICDRQAIPPRFLEQIFQDLKRADSFARNVVPKAATLGRPASEITLGDILRAVEGSVTLSESGYQDVSADDGGFATSAALNEVVSDRRAMLRRHDHRRSF